MRYRYSLKTVAAVMLLLSGCEDEHATCPVGPTFDSVPATVEVRIERSNDFALDLFQDLRTMPDNLIVSPHSITTVFGMVYAGARGETEREIAQALHFNYPPAGFHSALRELNQHLERPPSTDPEALQLQIANAMWARSGLPMVPAFLDTIRTNYSAEVDSLNFNQPEACRTVINDWVRTHTDGHIQELLLPGHLDPATQLVLVNTLFFSAGWLHKFDPYYTRNRTFTRLDQATVSPPTMSGEMPAPFGRGNAFTAVELAYRGEESGMLLLLPDEGHYDTFESELTAARIDSIAGSLRLRSVIVTLPKFSFSTRPNVEASLKRMGMAQAFRAGADFSGMTRASTFISFVAHKSFISVDEWGTIAAAGTGVGFTIGVSEHFEAERPFIFIIRDRPSGAILFAGRVLDPTQ